MGFSLDRADFENASDPAFAPCWSIRAKESFKGTISHRSFQAKLDPH